MRIYVNTITADRLSQSYLGDLRVLGAYPSFEEAIRYGKERLKFYYWWNKGKIDWRVEIHEYEGSKCTFVGAILKVKNKYYFRKPTGLGGWDCIALNLKKLNLLYESN